MGTTGRDRQLLHKTVEDANTYAVISPTDEEAGSVFKSATSRPVAPGIPTGESDSTFLASRPTSWRLEFFSRLVVDMADQVGRLGALRSPGPLGLPLEYRI
jgi:hypothetical protein